MLRCNIYLFNGNSSADLKYVDFNDSASVDEDTDDQLDQFYANKAVLSMKNTSITKLSNQIRFRLESEADYLKAVNCNMLAIIYKDNDQLADNVHEYICNITNVQYDQPQMVLISYQINPFLTYLKYSDFLSSKNYIQRSSIESYMTKSSVYNIDEMLDNKEADNLIHYKRYTLLNSNVKKYYIVYLKPSFDSDLTSKSIVNIDFKPNSQSITTGRVKGEYHALKREIIACLYSKFDDILNDNVLWSAGGSRIIGVEWRYISDDMIKKLKAESSTFDVTDDLTTYKLTYNPSDAVGDIVVDKNVNNYDKSKYKMYDKLQAQPYHKMIYHVSSYSYSPAYGRADVDIYDSLLPKFSPTVSMKMQDSNLENPNNSTEFGGKNSAKLDLDRSINVYTSGANAYLFSHRNSIYAQAYKIMNSVISRYYTQAQSVNKAKTIANNNLAKSNELTDITSKNNIANTANINANNSDNVNLNYKLSQEALKNTQTTALNNLTSSQTTAKTNLDNTQSNALSNLKNTQKVAKDNLLKTQLTALNNLQKVAKQAALDKLNTSYKAQVDNAQNSENVARHNIDTQFVTSEFLSSLGVAMTGGLAEAFVALLNSFLTGAVNDVKAKALLDTNYSGDGADSPAGVFKRLERSKKASVDSIEISNKASANEMTANQKTAIANLNNSQANELNNTQASQNVTTNNMLSSQKTEMNNLKHSQETAINNLTIDNQKANNNLSNSLKNSVLSINNSVVNSKATNKNSNEKELFNIDASNNTQLTIWAKTIQLEINNFTTQINSEIADHAHEAYQVSAGSGYVTSAEKSLELIVETYVQDEATMERNEEILEKFGWSIKRNGSLSDYANADYVSKDKYNYVQCSNTYIRASEGNLIPTQALNQINSAINNGLWIRGYAGQSS